MNEKYAVLGAGNAGTAFAGHLGLKGFDTSLYEASPFASGDHFNAIKENKGIELRDILKGFGPLQIVTDDIQEAVQGRDIIIIAVPEFAQKTLFEAYLEHSEDGQTVVFFPGNYASFKFQTLVKESGKKLILAEASSIPYGARVKAPGTVDIIGWKDHLHVASLPSSETENTLKTLNQFNDVFIPGEDVLWVSLNNPNFVVHCTSTALNAGWIETSQGEFSLYWEGMSPSVVNVIEKVDEERLAVGKALGYELMSEMDFFAFYYNLTGNTLYEVIQKSENHGKSKSPKSLKDRYIEEDAPAGLTAIVSLGKRFGIPVPNCEAILRICSTLNQKDYYEIGLNEENLGIVNMSKEDIARFVQTGL